ncbi:MAG: hypothetical protein R3272_13945 [Candidatus Promineifilaceae bacterium]|nr:hypothetical protein [Candidatus Promineifilaceae bacterium]
MELQAITGQLYVIEGELQEGPDVPGLLWQAPPARAARGRNRDFLFVQLALSGSPIETATLAQDLLEGISKRFYKTPGSITAALRNAILEANRLLLQLNLNRRGGTLREGALACAVQRGEELFMVQVGEAFALIGRNFGVERLPARSPERVTPLGRSAGLDLRYYHNWLEPGDMLLLADPRLAYLPAEQLKPLLVDAVVEDSVVQLADLIGEETAQALLVEFTDEPVVALPERVVTPPTAADRHSARTLSPPTRQPLRAEHVAEEEAAVGTAPAVEQQPRRDPVRAVTRLTEQAKERAQDLSLPEVELPSASRVERGARTATARTAFGLSSLSGWLAALMHRLRPARTERDGEEEPGGWALPALVALLIPLLVAAIVSGVYLQRGRVTRMSELRQEMQANILLADEAETEAGARDAYNRVLVLAAEAEALRPHDDTIDRMRSEAQEALDRLDDITRLSSRRLYTYPEGSIMTGVVLREGFNGDIYTLDSGNNRLFAHDTEDDYVTFVAESPEPQEILFGGQAVGTHVVGNLVDMMWRERGTQVSSEGLAVLDGRGALLSFHPNFANLRAVPLGLASEWLRPAAITQFNERLYVLDRGAGQVWRYFPEGDGFYVEQSQRALTLPDLEEAVDVAIYSEDGSVIVLYGDGRLRRYGQDSLLWDESSLADSGLESPLVAPTRLKIVGRGLNASIFVADPGSGRIVQSSLGGTFLAQYKAVDEETGRELFSALGDFDVAEAPLRIVVVADEGLYVATQN